MRKVLFLVSVIGVSGLRSPNPVEGVTSPRSKRVEELESEVVVLKNKMDTLEKIVKRPEVQKAMGQVAPRAFLQLMRVKGVLVGKCPRGKDCFDVTDEEILLYKQRIALRFSEYGYSGHCEQLGISESVTEAGRLDK